MTLLVSRASHTCILVSLHSHTSHASHIFTMIYTFLLHHLTWEFEKPFISLSLHFASFQPKINELFFFSKMNLQGHVEEELLQEKEKRIEELEKEVKRWFPLKVEVITDKNNYYFNSL